jgi:Flp pilus assembly protein TadG
MKPSEERRARGKSRGQSMVEFALVLPIFMIFVMGIVDGGRAIFAYNQMSQISRDVSRVASVTCFQTTPRCATTPGAPIAAAIADTNAGTQGPVIWTVQCVDPETGAVHHLDPAQGAPFCVVGDLVRVNATQQFSMIYGILKDAFGTINVGSTSEQQILP